MLDFKTKILNDNAEKQDHSLKNLAHGLPSDKMAI